MRCVTLTKEKRIEKKEKNSWKLSHGYFTLQVKTSPTHTYISCKLVNVSTKVELTG